VVTITVAALQCPSREFRSSVAPVVRFTHILRWRNRALPHIADHQPDWSPVIDNMRFWGTCTNGVASPAASGDLGGTY